MQMLCKTLIAMVLVSAIARPLFGGEVTLAQISGDYALGLGTVPGLKDSADSIKVEAFGKMAKITWKLADGMELRGLGILVDDFLGVAFGGPDPMGLVVYKQKGGTLSGTWTVTSTQPGEIYTYTMTGPENLDGSFTIPSNGPGTGGTVTFTPKGKDVFGVKFELPSGTYSGVAVKAGDYIVAVNGGGEKFGAAGYICEKDMLTGYWATPLMEDYESDVISK